MSLIFPDPAQSDEEGLLCWGGNLHAETLLQAYSQGIFPWFTPDTPILWWSPPKRMIMKPEEIKVGKSLKSLINKNAFDIKFDTDFEAIINACALTNRNEEDGTWITKEMIKAYIKLHELGYAHCVGAYKEGDLAGGLYGVSLGRAFFGESMFYKQSNASKVAFYHLTQKLISWNFHFIDAQQETTHLKSLGAYTVDRDFFLNLLHKTLQYKTFRGNWHTMK